MRIKGTLSDLVATVGLLGGTMAVVVYELAHDDASKIGRVMIYTVDGTWLAFKWQDEISRATTSDFLLSFSAAQQVKRVGR